MTGLCRLAPEWECIGITPAPASVTRTKAEALIRQYAPEVHRTREQAADAELRREIQCGVRAGTSEGLQRAGEAAASGELSKRQVAGAVKSAGRSFLEAGFQRLTLRQPIRVYEVASEEERAQLHPMLLQKGLLLLQAAPNERAELAQLWRKAVALPFAKAPVPVPLRTGASALGERAAHR